MNDNVVKFPKLNWASPTSNEEAEQRLEEFKNSLLMIFLDDFVPFLLAKLNSNGITIENYHDIALINEVLKSSIMRFQGRSHPFQQMADESFEFKDDPEAS